MSQPEPVPASVAVKKKFSPQSAPRKPRSGHLVAVTEEHWRPLSEIADRFGITPAMVLTELLNRHLDGMRAEDRFTLTRRPDPSTHP